MSYGRKTIMDGLRKAGTMLGNADKAYTDAVRKVPAFNNPGSGVPFNEMFKYPNEGVGWKERRIVNAMAAGVLASNVASRYALPLGGVTLAGKGLHDLTVGLQQQTEHTLMPE